MGSTRRHAAASPAEALTGAFAPGGVAEAPNGSVLRTRRSCIEYIRRGSMPRPMGPEMILECPPSSAR